MVSIKVEGVRVEQETTGTTDVHLQWVFEAALTMGMCVFSNQPYLFISWVLGNL